MRGPFRRHGDRIDVLLDPAARAMLGALAGLLGDARPGATGRDDGRPPPIAYPDDPEAQAEFARLAGPELDAARSADLAVFRATVPAATTLTPAEAEAWVRVVGDARLVLAARAGLFEDEGSPPGREEDPHRRTIDWLGAIQHLLVEELSAEG